MKFSSRFSSIKINKVVDAYKHCVCGGAVTSHISEKNTKVDVYKRQLPIFGDMTIGTGHINKVQSSIKAAMPARLVDTLYERN